jgi:transcriptional regulator with XRE-family HTH domain
MDVSYKNRLKELMDAKGIGRGELASEIGISYQGVRKVFDSDGAFGSENNLKAADYFGVNPRWLATGEGDSRPTKAQEPVGYSAEALALAWLLDQIPNRLDKTIANNSATAAILEVLQRSGAKPTHKPVQSVTPAKQTS